jgi:ribosomal protein S5
MVWATMDGLRELVTVEQVARERDVAVDTIQFRPRQEVVRG